MISQDQHEIWITVGEFSDEYVDFLAGKRKEHKQSGFLEMREYGPLDVANAGDMQDVGQMLLALSIQLCKEP